MKHRTLLKFGILIAALSLMWPALAPAAVVGRFTLVEGRVDRLKGGKLPAIPAKLDDAVESGDVIRTKTRSRAQITFIDNSVITISPDGRLAVEDYSFDPAKGKRTAVLEIFKGLAHVVVKQIFKVEEPDFIIKTHTAVTGVRGTDFGIRLHPISSTIMNFEGKTQVANIFPEAAAMINRAQKIAFGGPGGGWFSPGAFVTLGNMQGTEVFQNRPPTLPFNITAEDRKMFMQHMVTSALGRQSGAGGGGGMAMASTGSSGGGGVSPDLGALGGGAINPNNNPIINTVVTVPPTVTPTQGTNSGTGGGGSPPTPPTPPSYNFSQTFVPLSLSYLATQVTPTAPALDAALFASTSGGTGTRTGVYPGSFTTSLSITANSPQAGTFPPSSTGSFLTITGSGNVAGTLGSALQGTMNVTAKTSGGAVFNLAGPVTIQPSGNLSFTPTGTAQTGGVTSTTNGTWNQTPKTP